MSDIYEGGPAFPASHFDLAEGEHGMTLRDYFAAKAIAGILAGGPEVIVPMSSGPRGKPAELGAAAYDIADAMLKARQ